MELFKGLTLAAVSFIGLIALCVALGKAAGYFSPYKDRK